MQTSSIHVIFRRAMELDPMALAVIQSSHCAVLVPSKHPPLRTLEKSVSTAGRAEPMLGEDCQDRS